MDSVINQIINNEMYINLISIAVYLVTFLICAFHLKKYGFIQAIFSLICIPMIMYGIGELLIFIFKENTDLVSIITLVLEPLMYVYNIHKYFYTMTNIEWLYNTKFIFMPSIIVFIFVYGYSITFYRKRKSKKNSKVQE